MKRNLLRNVQSSEGHMGRNMERSMGRNMRKIMEKIMEGITIRDMVMTMKRMDMRLNNKFVFYKMQIPKTNISSFLP